MTPARAISDLFEERSQLVETRLSSGYRPINSQFENLVQR
jgi:hypothetical protein